MHNKTVPSVSMMIMIGSFSLVATSSMLYQILLQEAIAQTTDQRNDNDNKMLTYENSTYGIRMQYPSGNSSLLVDGGDSAPPPRMLQIRSQEGLL
jgi:hypothetical protein